MVDGLEVSDVHANPMRTFSFYGYAKCLLLGLDFFVTGISLVVSGALISAPIVYWSCDTCFKDGNLCWGDASGDWENGECNGWQIKTLKDTFALCGLGILAMILTLHISNGFAFLSKELTRCALATEKSEEGLSTGLLSAQNQNQVVPSQSRAQTIHPQDYCQCDQHQASTPSISQHSLQKLQSPIVIILDESKQVKHDAS